MIHTFYVIVRSRRSLEGELVGLVEQLLAEVSGLGERVSALEAENAALREEHVRLKGLKGRPKLKPSGMAEATNRPRGKRQKGKRAARRSPKINEERKLSLDAPAGSRLKGYDDFPWLALAAGQPEHKVQDLRLEGRASCWWRRCRPGCAVISVCCSIIRAR